MAFWIGFFTQNGAQKGSLFCPPPQITHKFCLRGVVGMEIWIIWDWVVSPSGRLHEGGRPTRGLLPPPTSLSFGWGGRGGRVWVRPASCECGMSHLGSVRRLCVVMINVKASGRVPGIVNVSIHCTHPGSTGFLYSAEFLGCCRRY
jgi:hypothetical protein